MLATLFDPFKHRSLGNERLGLYIAHQVVCGHHGSLTYRPGPGTVSFEVRIPLQPPASPSPDVKLGE
jgi:signal transduction histidine kinase